MGRLFSLLLVTGVLAGLAGCGNGPPSPGPDHGPRAPRDTNATPGEGRPAEVRMEVVNYDALQKAIASHRGKVVILDVWATWCVPCKREFPHLVALHRRHAKVGVVCLSVSVDEAKQREAVLEFLKAKGATFPNYLLDEDAAVWQDKWDLKGIPAVFVYGRDGKLARKFTNDDPDDQYTYDDVRKLVEGMLGR
jgi:thiol-disulfide isomerase/thioredoxin